MEFITDKLIDNLKSKGVIFEQCDFGNINFIPNSQHISYKDEKFDQALITTNLSNLNRIFNFETKTSYEHFVSQVFIYFTFKKVNFKFQYLQVNDLSLYCSRISNCSLYSKFTEEDNHVIVAEIPLSSKNKLWNDDSKLKEIAWEEIKKCGIISENENYNTAKILKIPRTFSLPKVNFFKILNQTELKLKKQFSGNVNMIGQGIFTRHKFVKELLAKLN